MMADSEITTTEALLKRALEILADNPKGRFILICKHDRIRFDRETKAWMCLNCGASLMLDGSWGRASYTISEE